MSISKRTILLALMLVMSATVPARADSDNSDKSRKAVVILSTVSSRIHDTLTIHGKGFGDRPAQVWCQDYPLTVISWMDREIVVHLPDALPDGSHLLTIIRGEGQKDRAVFDMAVQGKPTSVPGQKGDPGAKGDKGDIGATGLRGDIGVAGVKGDTGAIGPQGEPGPMGPMGPAGPAGPVGAAGAQGASGVTGAAGPTGSRGLTGATGPQGPPGPVTVGALTGSPCTTAAGSYGALTVRTALDGAVSFSCRASVDPEAPPKLVLNEIDYDQPRYRHRGLRRALQRRPWNRRPKWARARARRR